MANRMNERIAEIAEELRDNGELPFQNLPTCWDRIIG